MGFRDWLNTNSGAITGIGALITAIATVVLVCITAFYAWVTRQMRLDAQKPEITVFLRPRELDIGRMVLCVRNIGEGPAKNIQFTCITDTSIDDISYPEFIKGIPYLASGQKIEDIIEPITVRDQLIVSVQTPIGITVTYKDSMNNKYVRGFSLNSQLYQGVTQIDDLLFDIHNALQSIGESLSSISEQIEKE